MSAAPRGRSMVSPLDPIVVMLFAITWCGLWGEISLANVVSGLLIGVVLRVALHSESTRRTVRFVPLARLIALVTVDLVKSTAHVVYDVLTPTDYTDEVIVEVVAGPDAVNHLLLLTTAITLTPGTALVDADSQTGTLYLHLLYADTEASVAEHVSKLVRLATQAFPPEADAASTEEVVA